MNEKFSIKKALWFGFSEVIEHFAYFIVIMMMYVGTMLGGLVLGLPIAWLPFASDIFRISQTIQMVGVPQAEWSKLIMSETSSGLTIATAILLIFIYFLYGALSLGLIRIALDYYQYGKSTFQALFSCFHLVIRYGIATFLYALMCGIGLMFFIVPGIYFAITYGFYGYAMVDKDAGIFDSFAISRDITRGYKMDLLGFCFLLWLIKWAALSLIGIAWIVVLPASLLADAYVYKRLLGE